MNRRTLLLAVVLQPADELLEPMNRFAALYNDFTAKLREGVFDARQAKRLSKLWRSIEGSGSWPRQ